MKIEHILEGISQKLYHLTDIGNAAKILATNRFRLTPDIGTKSEIALRSSKKKVYYLSTARNLSSDFFQKSSRMSGVIFVLDGQKLAHNYSGGPVDYWGPDFRKIDPTRHEMEDRIFSAKPYIENASEYIKEIHVLLSEKANKQVQTSRLRKLIIEAKKKKYSCLCL